MKKLSKKLVTILLATLMIFSLCACSKTEDNNDAPVEDQKIVIGGLAMGAAASSLKSAEVNVDELCKTYGAEVIRAAVSGYDDQSMLATYESLIDQGCNALTVYTFSESAIRLVADLCEERDVYWFLANRQITNPDLKDYVFGCEHFVGNGYCQETEIAYDLTVELNEKHGVKNLAIIGLQQGDINGDYRDAGIAKACEEKGINILTETRGISTVDDVTNTVEGIIASYPEVDGIFVVGGAVTTGALAGANQALANHNMEDKVSIALIDIEAGMENYMGEGKALKICAGGNLGMDMMMPAICLINHFKGVNVDEEAYIINTHMQYLRTAEDVIDFDTYCQNTEKPLYTGNEWDALVGQNNSVIQTWVDNFNADAMKK